MKKLACIITILAFTANTFAASAGIACGGRISKTTGGYEITYFITDHLGSTRAIVNSNGDIVAQYNYYPFGKQWEDPSLMANTNRYTFSGKEKQITGDINYMDFGSRMYDDFLGRWFAIDPRAEDYYPLSPYAYCANNPIIYADENGEFIHIIIGAVVGGVVNWVSHGCKFNSQGLAYFGAGAAAGALTAAFPGAAPFIAGGLGASNSILQQGYANGWNNIKWGQVAFDGIMSGLTSYVGGQFGKYMENTKLGNLVNSIESPLLRNFVGAEMVGVPFSAVTSGLFEYSNGGSFWHGVWDGTKSGFVSSGISAIGASVQYSLDYKVNLITGKYKIPLYHYTSEYKADIIMNSQLGLTEDGWVYLTPDGTKTPLQAQIDLALPQGHTGESLIMVKPNSISPKNVIIQRSVTGNVYGRGGGGYEIIYKGTIELKYLKRVK